MVRRSALALGVLAALLAVGYAVAAANHWYRDGGDAFCFWTAARFVVSGQDPYDGAAWRSATAGLSCAGAYAYPLWTAITMAPLGLLPLEAAMTTWMAISIGAALAGTMLVWRAVAGSHAGALLFLLLVVTSQPFAVLLISGQTSGVELGLVGLAAFLLAAGRQGGALAAVSGLALKPQLAALPIVALGARALYVRDRRAIIGLAAPLLAASAISLAISPSWVIEWVAASVGPRLRVAELLPTAWGLSADVVGTPWLAPVLIALLVAAIVAPARRRLVKGVELFAVSLAVGLFSAPHAWSYDFLVLALPWAIALAAAYRTSGMVRAALLGSTIAVGSVLPWLLYAFAQSRGGEPLSAVIPALSALLVAVSGRIADPYASS